MTKQPSAARRLFDGLKEVLLVILGALIISALLRAFVFEPFTIPSGSMENTLQVNDKVIAQKVTDFKRGDVIVFRDPADWVAGTGQPRSNPAAVALEFIGVLPNSSDDFLTKRVIGVPGDHVKCCDEQGRLTVNGVAVDESTYLFSAISSEYAHTPASELEFDIVVPRDSLFVLGDHRDASADSRCHLKAAQAGQPGAAAFVPVDQVVGALGAIIAPFERWQQLRTPEAFATIPDPTGEPPDQAVITQASQC